MMEKCIMGLVNSADSILEVAKTGNRFLLPVYYLFSLIGMAISLPVTLIISVPIISNAQVRELLKKSVITTIRMVGVSAVGLFLSPFAVTSFIVVTIEVLESSLNGFGTSLKYYDRPYDEDTVTRLVKSNYWKQWKRSVFRKSRHIQLYIIAVNKRLYV